MRYYRVTGKGPRYITQFRSDPSEHLLPLNGGIGRGKKYAHPQHRPRHSAWGLMSACCGEAVAAPAQVPIFLISGAETQVMIKCRSTTSCSTRPMTLVGCR